MLRNHVTTVFAAILLVVAVTLTFDAMGFGFASIWLPDDSWDMGSMVTAAPVPVGTPRLGL